MFGLSRKEEKFYDYFIEFAKIAADATLMLKNFVEDPKNVEVKFREIEEIEHRGDKQLHDIMEALNKTYLTPFDREDIYKIGKSFDDIIDSVEATASRFILLNTTDTSRYAIDIANKIAMCGKHIIIIGEEMKNMKGNTKLKDAIIEINDIESSGDAVFRTAVKELFSKEHELSDAELNEIIKMKEIYECLEQTLDACEDFADEVEGIVMKHS